MVNPVFTNPVFRIMAVRTTQASVLALGVHALLRWPWTGTHALGLFLTPLLCAYFVFVFVAPWRWGLPILTRLPTRERVVALTFDDGPSPEITPHLLETLAQRNVHATFFVLGSQIERQASLVRRIAESGHAVGLHGQTHDPLVLPSWGQVCRSLSAARTTLETACPGVTLRWLRPPHGFKTVALPFLARHLGLRLCAWNVNSRDYHCADPQQIARNVLRQIRPGAIVLLHDGAANKATLRALPLILDGLAQAGYQCVLLP